MDEIENKDEIEIIVEEDVVVDVEPKVVDEDLDALRQQLQQEKDDKLRATRELAVERERGRTAQAQARQATEGQIQAQLDSVENGIKALTAEADKLEQDVVQAAADGKWADHAKLTRLLATAQGRIEQLNSAKAQIGSAREQVKQGPDLSAYTPKTQEWIKRHPEFLSDQAFHAKAMAAHYRSQAEGIEPDSDAYFSMIDEATEASTKPEPKPEKPKGKTTAAPVSRTSAPNVTQKSGNSVRLTSQEAEIARMTNPDDPPEVAYKKYAVAKQELIASGKIAGNA